MKKIRVFYDHWLENKLKVEERATLMALFYEMDKRNKVIVPSFEYINQLANVSNSIRYLRRMQNKKILKFKFTERKMIEIKLVKGKTERVPENLFLIKGKWEKTLMLTFYLLKGYKEYAWTDRGELANLFDCYPGTITLKLKELDKKGYIVKQRYAEKYKITPLI